MINVIKYALRHRRSIQEQPVEEAYEMRDLPTHELDEISENFVRLFCETLAHTKQTLINYYGFDGDDIGTMTDTSFDVMLNSATMHVLEHVIIDDDHLQFNNWTLDRNLAPIFYIKIEQLTSRFNTLTAGEREAINDRLYCFANNAVLTPRALAWYTTFNAIRRDLIETHLVNDERFRQQFFNAFNN